MDQKDSFACLLSMMLLAAVMPLVLLTAPILVGAMIGELGFSEPQGGYIISLEQGAMALASLPALLWINRVHWHRVAYLALTVMLLGNVVSSTVTSFAALAAIRFATAFAGGSIMLICLTTVSMTQNQERNFALWVVGQLILAVIALATLPHLIAAWGMRAFYYVLIVCISLLFFTVHYLPAKGKQATSAPANSKQTNSVQANSVVDRRTDAQPKDARPKDARIDMYALVGLGSVLFFGVALSGVWTYLERIASHAQISSETIGYALSIASLFGIAGALSATLLQGRVGRRLPVIAGLTAMSISVALLFGNTTVVLFFLAASLFKFTWTFVFPYLLACLSSVDQTGRLVVMTNLIIGTSLAFGPALAAFSVGWQGSYTAVLILGTGCGLISLFLILPLTANGEQVVLNPD